MSRCVFEGVSPEIVHTASFGGDVKQSVPGDLGPRLCLLQALVSHHCGGKPLKGFSSQPLKGFQVG